MHLRLFVTDDIPESTRRELVDAWKDIGGLERAGVVFLRSAEPPSFIQIMGEALQWLSPLKVAATVFLSQLAKEAATEIYKNKAKIAEALAQAAAAPLRRAAASLKQARHQSPRHPRVVLGLSMPDDYFGTALSITHESEEEIAYLLASFVTKAEAIQQVIQAEIDAGRRPLGRVQVVPTGAGGLRLVWMDQQFGKHEREIS